MPREVTLPANFAPDFEPVLSQDPGVYTDAYPVVHLRRTFVTHSGIALRHLRPVPETLFPMAPYRDTHLTRYARYKFLASRRTRPDADDLLLLHNHWSTGFYHWVVEVILKIQFIDPTKHTVIVPGGYPGFARESLLLFDWRAAAVIPPGHSIVADDLTVVSNPPTSAVNPAHVDWLRRTLREKCDIEDAPPVRVYLTRRNTYARRILNEEEVLATLGHYDFQCVDPAELSFTEQVRLFARCEALVAAHGAGLTNLVFMSPGSSVLELSRQLTPTLPFMNSDFWSLATAAGLRYHYQFCAYGPKLGPKAVDVDFTVDVSKLSDNVEAMLAG